MAEVIPFKGVLYNPQKVDLSSVMAPPYDIVTPEFKEVLYSRSPYNIIRIDFGKDNAGDNDKENRYTRASRWLNEWLKKGILIQDTTPAFYCYEATYEINGHEKKLRGFLGVVKIEELGYGKIHPHEMTYSKPRADRLAVIRYCQANISPIFSLYSSPKRLSSSILKKIVEEKALIEAKDGDGFIHRLWRINDRITIEAIKKELSDKDIFIADGHHRYETALEFKNEMERKGMVKTGTEPFNYVMMFLANIEDNSLTLLPTHRIIKSVQPVSKRLLTELKPFFKIKTINFNTSTEESARQEMFNTMKNNKHSLGMFIKEGNAYYVLSFSSLEINSHKSLKNLEVVVLHKFIFEKLLKVDDFEYEMNPELAVEKVRKGSYQAVFFLNPTRIEDVKKVALAGQRMPPKSTYFYPKLLTGMVIYKF
jgi:uncharacterized protein (DUF1015 family)